MSDTVSNTSTTTRPPLSIVRTVIFPAASVIVAAVSVYFCWFFCYLNLPLSDDPTTWGAFGDYVGGLANPMIALVALFYLARSVHIQAVELTETRAALVESSVAQTRQGSLAVIATRIQGLSTALSAATEDFKFQLQVMETYNKMVRLEMYELEDEEGNTVPIARSIQECMARTVLLRRRMDELVSAIEELNEQAAKG